MKANPEDFASGASCLVRYLCFQILPKAEIIFFYFMNVLIWDQLS